MLPRHVRHDAAATRHAYAVAMRPDAMFAAAIRAATPCLPRDGRWRQMPDTIADGDNSVTTLAAAMLLALYMLRAMPAPSSAIIPLRLRAFFATPCATIEFGCAAGAAAAYFRRFSPLLRFSLR